MVTVVDALNFLRDYDSVDNLQARGTAMGEEDTRTIVDLLADQVEFANVILVNKIDLVTPEDRHRIHAMISALNPKAKVYETTNSEVALDKVMGTGLFDLAKAERAAGWLDSLIEISVLRSKNEAPLCPNAIPSKNTLTCMCVLVFDGGLRKLLEK